MLLAHVKQPVLDGLMHVAQLEWHATQSPLSFISMLDGQTHAPLLRVAGVLQAVQPVGEPLLIWHVRQVLWHVVHIPLLLIVVVDVGHIH